MKKFKICVTKKCLKKALRTFIQTAVGYAVTNVSLCFTGADLANGDYLKDALIGLAVSAISAGIAAVMNLEKGKSITTNG